jgi:hypothetical protein
MRFRHKSGSGGRSFRLYLERCSTAGRGPAVGLSALRHDGRLHILRDDMERPAPLGLAAVASESPAAAGFREIDPERLPGLYDLALPAGLFTGGSAGLIVALAFPGVESAVLEVELVAYDPYDAVGIGLDGFTKAVRHQNLTSILVHVMPDSVRTLARERRTR